MLSLDATTYTKYEVDFLHTTCTPDVTRNVGLIKPMHAKHEIRGVRVRLNPKGTGVLSFLNVNGTVDMIMLLCVLNRWLILTKNARVRDTCTCRQSSVLWI